MSQQTPSTQFPDAHSLASVHVVPFVFVHVPDFFASLELHVMPTPHEAAVQQTPSVQKPVDGQSPEPVHG